MRTTRRPHAQTPIEPTERHAEPMQPGALPVSLPCVLGGVRDSGGGCCRSPESGGASCAAWRRWSAPRAGERSPVSRRPLPLLPRPAETRAHLPVPPHQLGLAAGVGFFAGEVAGGSVAHADTVMRVPRWTTNIAVTLADHRDDGCPNGALMEPQDSADTRPRNAYVQPPGSRARCCEDGVQRDRSRLDRWSAGTRMETLGRPGGEPEMLGAA